MKRILLLIYWFFALSSLAYSQNSNIEDVILDKAAELPEVKSFIKTAKASKPALLIAGTPTKDFKYYRVKVGINNADMFRTNFNFYVDPKTHQIFYADYMTEQGEQILTLGQWRKWRRLPVWQQWHCYKHTGKKLVIYVCNP